MNGRSSRLCAVLLLPLTLVIAAATPAAFAITYQVNTVVDEVDNDCFTDGDCSLRDAIRLANRVPSTLDHIMVPAGTYLLTIAGDDEDVGATGDLDITGAVYIIGQGPGQTIIDATGLGDRVLHVNAPGENVMVVGLTITGGYLSTNTDSGGGIKHYRGTLGLSYVEVAENWALLAGGGVYAVDTLTVNNGSVISNNTSAAGGGGGIAFAFMTGTLTITESTVTGNQSQDSGGGIYLYDSFQATISASTVSHNSTVRPDSGGGGLRVQEAHQTGLTNCTLFGNSSGGPGGAILMEGDSELSLHSVTISENEGIYDILLADSLNELTLTNTIISGLCDIVGTVTSEGGNLQGPLASCGLNPVFDQIGVADLGLGPLGDFGGWTRTVLPFADSPAVGGGSTTYCLDEDQRGASRPVGVCDAGAVERQPSDPDPIFFDGFESGDLSGWGG